MKLTIFNGSPKPGKNNTEVIAMSFADGFKLTDGNSVEMFKFDKMDSPGAAVKIFAGAEYVLIAFPLYSYSMPSGVKEFFERLEPLCGRCSNIKLAFLVQYGFPESTHARPLEKYLEFLCSRLGCQYLGTIIRGKCDGVSRAPARYKKLLCAFKSIGTGLGKTGMLDKDELAVLAGPEKQAFLAKLIMPLAVKLINRLYWAPMLKKNGVFGNSFAKPYSM